MGVAPYDDPRGLVLADFSDTQSFADRRAQPGISASLETAAEPVKIGRASGRLTAANANETAVRSWCKIGTTFSPPLDLSGQQALGLWVHGDGRGEVLNLQQTSPAHLSHAIADHYITIDFTGWRCFSLVEPEVARHADYAWPYGGAYAIYRESIRPGAVETLSLWYNNIPPKETVTCCLSPIRALPVMPHTLRDPALTVGGKTIRFPVEIETGQFLEFHAAGQCTLYGPKGEELRRVTPVGDVPRLAAGENQVEFACQAAAGVSPRAYITVITQGAAFGNSPAGRSD